METWHRSISYAEGNFKRVVGALSYKAGCLLVDDVRDSSVFILVYSVMNNTKAEPKNEKQAGKETKGIGEVDLSMPSLMYIIRNDSGGVAEKKRRQKKKKKKKARWK